MKAKDVAEFIRAVLPAAIDLVVDLYHLFDGDSSKAVRLIRDRRDEIAQKRRERDEQLRRKPR